MAQIQILTCKNSDCQKEFTYDPHYKIPGSIGKGLMSHLRKRKTIDVETNAYLKCPHCNKRDWYIVIIEKKV